jgi:DNA-binding transcriptional regulator YdaS (Cro superfamily)
MTQDDVIARLRASVAVAGNQKAWAKENGYSGAYVCQVLKGRRSPSVPMCRRLGVLKRKTEVVTYAPID